MPRGVYERKPRTTAATTAAPTPPQPGKKRKYAKSARPAAAVQFIPAIDAENRLVLVNGSAPHIFNPQQTQAIADLLLMHFE